MTMLAVLDRPIQRASRFLDRLINRYAALRTRLGGAFAWLRRGYAVHRQRRELLALDERN
jgi:hypothetical protein